MFILMVAPILAIPVFWLLPLGQAIIVYVIALTLSGSMFWVMRGNRHRPVKTGKESLIGRDVEITARTNGTRPRYTIRIEGELWTARSNDVLKTGEEVTITASEDNTLIVSRKDDTGLIMNDREPRQPGQLYQNAEIIDWWEEMNATKYERSSGRQGCQIYPPPCRQPRLPNTAPRMPSLPSSRL
jgi:membrane protein implicated in regulation of membrane protease activity